jgi:primosomal protein N' (replication factor Y)
VLGPEEPGIARIRNFYHQNIMLKLEKKASTKKVKEILKVQLEAFNVHSEYKSVRVGVDVDPM